jgi:hypothetical protein
MNSVRRTIILGRIIGCWPITFAQKRARKFLAGLEKPGKSQRGYAFSDFSKPNGEIGGGL